jgi:DNA-binding CsgD family transcriptional regulator/PAS domain-containing protein
LLDLVGSIYASATEPDALPQTLSALSKTVQGEFAQILTLERGSGRVLHSCISDAGATFEKAHDRYVSQWAALDPRAAWLASLPPGSVARCHETFDDAFIGTSSFYQEYLIPLGFRWALAGVLDSGPDTLTAIVNVRKIDSPPFEDWAAAALQQLLPHFQKAHLIRVKLEQQAAAGASAVEMIRALPVPCLFTDHAGRCVERNRAFEEIMEAFSVQLVIGRVRFPDSDLQNTWETALSDTHATALGHTFAATAPNGKQWGVHLIPSQPLPGNGEAVDAKMILVVFEPKAAYGQASVESVALGAKLTRAELEVATSLLQGFSAKVIAKQRGASVNTVRSQITSILEKTGYKSQRELIAAVGASSFGNSVFSIFQSNPLQGIR